MRFKPTVRFMLFAVLCVCLTSVEVWLRNALAVNTGRIVFTSMRDGNPEIYVMDADGGNQERLTNHPASDAAPDWSPDGTRIAFASWSDGNGDIYVMDADGKNVIRLTEGRGRKGDPDWSPDEGKIVFDVDDRVDHIAVMDADGRNRKKLEDQALYPSWSPDGGTIAFLSSRDGGNELYVIGADGQGRNRVTQDLADKWNPSFSPDGRRIAYAAKHEGFYHIYVVGADGRNRVKLTHIKKHHANPTWSPDGQAIAYSVIEDGDFRGTIHLIASDGKYLRQLSDAHDARDSEPDISPLGLAVSLAPKTAAIWARLKIPFDK